MSGHKPPPPPRPSGERGGRPQDPCAAAECAEARGARGDGEGPTGTEGVGNGCTNRVPVWTRSGPFLRTPTPRLGLVGLGDAKDPKTCRSLPRPDLWRRGGPLPHSMAPPSPPIGQGATDPIDTRKPKECRTSSPSVTGAQATHNTGHGRSSPFRAPPLPLLRCSGAARPPPLR